MRNILGFGLLLVSAIGWGNRAVIPCPQGKVTYQNGITLKDSYGRFFYSNGLMLKDGYGRLYYGNGNSLRDSYGRFYFSNGNLLLDSYERLFYPNGAMLRDGSGRFYHSTGNILKDSYGRFFYANGVTARDSAGHLYRSDGSPTTFPIRVTSNYGGQVALAFALTSITETIELIYPDLQSTSWVKLTLLYNSGKILPEFVISTGYSDEPPLKLTYTVDGKEVCVVSLSR